MPHLLESKLKNNQDLGKEIVVEHKIINRDIMTREQYAELFISAFYGSYDNFLQRITEYMIDHPEGDSSLKNSLF